MAGGGYLPGGMRWPLYELSRSRARPGGDAPSACLSNNAAGKIRAVDFEALMGEWYGIAEREDGPKGGGHSPCRCDALYARDGELYLIEFKAGKSRPDKIEICRKIYDSVIGLVEKGGERFEFCRNHVRYILVEKRLDAESIILHRVDERLERFWENPAACQLPWLEPISGVLVRGVYRFSPSQFERYAGHFRWS